MSTSVEMPMSMSMSMSIVKEVTVKKQQKKLTKKYVHELIEECGRLYNFDVKEALIKLNLEKEKVKKEKKEKMLVPFDGTKKEGCCNGIVKNNGLYTQCPKKVENGFCKTCESQPYGNIDQRLSVGVYEYKDPKGKSPKRYLDVLKKKKISKEEIESWLVRENIQVAEAHLEESPEKVKRGRPKSEKKVKEPTGKKGRPKKEKKVVETPNQEDDLFASLVAQAQAQAQVQVQVPVQVQVQVPVQEVVAPPKEVAKEEAKVEKPKKVKAAKEPKEATGKKGRPKKENKPVEVNGEAEVVTPKKLKVEVEEETADVVKKIDFEGKSYYKSKKSGIIYNMDQEVVGKWNEESERIDFEEEEVEDEYEE
jgi:hypothetical protein